MYENIYKITLTIERFLKKVVNDNGKTETLKFSIWKRILTYQVVEEIFKHKSRELLSPWPNDRQIYKKAKGDKLIKVKKTPREEAKFKTN